MPIENTVHKSIREYALFGPQAAKSLRSLCARYHRQYVLPAIFVSRFTAVAFLLALNSGCVAVPYPAEGHSTRCEISTDRLTLKVIDLAKETDSYYTVEGYLVSPILVPTTAIISGVYVLVHNTYHLGEEKIVCG